MTRGGTVYHSCILREGAVLGDFGLHERRHVALHSPHVGLEVANVIRNDGELGLDGLEGFEKKFVCHVVGHLPLTPSPRRPPDGSNHNRSRHPDEDDGSAVTPQKSPAEHGRLI